MGTEPSARSPDPVFTGGRNPPFSAGSQASQGQSYTPPQVRRSHGQLNPPNLSPHTQRRASPTPARSHERSMSHSEFSSLPSQKYDHQSAPNMLQVSANPKAPYEITSTGRRSPRIDRVPSPSPLSQPAASTLPRSFVPFRTSGGCRTFSSDGKCRARLKAVINAHSFGEEKPAEREASHWSISCPSFCLF